MDKMMGLPDMMRVLNIINAAGVVTSDTDAKVVVELMGRMHAVMEDFSPSIKGAAVMQLAAVVLAQNLTAAPYDKTFSAMTAGQMIAAYIYQNMIKLDNAKRKSGSPE